MGKGGRKMGDLGEGGRECPGAPFLSHFLTPPSLPSPPLRLQVNSSGDSSIKGNSTTVLLYGSWVPGVSRVIPAPQPCFPAQDSHTRHTEYTVIKQKGGKRSGHKRRRLHQS